MTESMPRIEAKRRVLNCTYNSRTLEQIAGQDLALMDGGLKAGYGALTGWTAMDILNVVRGSRRQHRHPGLVRRGLLNGLLA